MKNLTVRVMKCITEVVCRIMSPRLFPSRSTPYTDITSKTIDPGLRRMLRPDERALIKCLLASADEGSFVAADLEMLEAIPLNDGGMGSLRLLPVGLDLSRSYGGDIALKQFTDSDGIPISVSLFVDKQRFLFEVDIAKGDLSPVIQFPQCDE